MVIEFFVKVQSELDSPELESPWSSSSELKQELEESELPSGTNSPPEKFAVLRHAAACCGMLQAVGGGNLTFQKASKVANRYIKHKPWVSVQHRCPMPSPIAHCKQSVVLLVVSLFLLGCVVPSAVGSTVDIRRQSEDNKGLSKHNTTRKEKRGGGDRSA